jgi:hypothetical protein
VVGWLTWLIAISCGCVDRLMYFIAVNWCLYISHFRIRLVTESLTDKVQPIFGVRGFVSGCSRLQGYL